MIALATACLPSEPAVPVPYVPAARAVSYVLGGQPIRVACRPGDGLECEPADGRPLDEHLAAAVAEVARADLACPETAARPVANGGMPWSFWTASGCGRSATYLGAVRRQRARVETSTFGFVRVGDGSLRAAMASALPEAADSDYAVRGFNPTSRDMFLGDLSDLDALVAQASRDLECPARSLVPSYDARLRHAQISVVEGCDKRVTYMPGTRPPFRAVAVVPVR